MLEVYPIILETSSYLKSYNFYLVKRAGKLILIDAGVDSDECWEQFSNTLAKHQFKMTDIEAIILTHHHDDHIGMINRLRKKYDLPVYVHKKAWKRLERDEAFLEKRYLFFEKLYDEMGCYADSELQLTRLAAAITDKTKQVSGSFKEIKAGQQIYGFDVIEVPGHSPDHIALYDQETKTLFLGDLVISHTSSNAIVDLNENGERMLTLVDYEASLRKILTYEVNLAYAGHGNHMEDFNHVVKRKIRHIERKAERIKNLLKTEKTAAMLAKELYPQKYETMLYFIMSEIIGHLDRLLAENAIIQEEKDGVIYFRQKENR